jgi:prephenate dehydrogenase
VTPNRSQRIAVIGLGLIGGSTMRALAAAGHHVLGYDADPTTRATARTAAARAPQGARWQIAPSISSAVQDADLVVVAVPLPAVESVFVALAKAGHTGVVTDVTSVKGAVRDLVTTVLHGAGLRLTAFVGGHPMAGRESSGFAAADSHLFDDAAWVLCLDEDTSLDEWLRLAHLLTTAMTVRVVPTTAAEHDRAVASISHVPHLLAAALAALAGHDQLALSLGAGSFRDGTRVAASRPALIAAMCGGNAAATRAALDAVITDLQAARAALDAADPIAALEPWLAPGANTRTAWPSRSGPTEPLAATRDDLLVLGRDGGWITAVSADRREVTAVRPSRPA